MVPLGLAKCWVLLLVGLHVQASTWTSQLDHGKVVGFPSYDQALTLLSGWLQQYPQLLKKEEIGKSYEGRPIHAYVISAGADGLFESRPEVLITSLMHAREPAGLTAVLYFMGHLLELNEQGDPNAVYVIQTRKLYFVPFVNPDGYVANEKVLSKVIRKNQRPGCANKAQSGVDLNRNFAFHWKAEFDPCNEEYQGTAPFSEPETQALKKLIEAHSFRHAINFHTFGGMLTHPYNFGQLSLPADDEQVYHEIAEVFKWPRFGTALQTVGYTAHGESDDWMYSQHHIISMSPEVGPETGNFWPPASLVEGIDRRNYDRTLYVVKKAGLELALSWAHMPPTAAGASDSSGDLKQRLQGAGGLSGKLQLSLNNTGISRSAGQALNVAVSGATRSSGTKKWDTGFLVLQGEGAQASPTLAHLIYDSENTVAAPILAFQAPPLERRSSSPFQVILGASLEADTPTRSLTLCAVEMPRAADPLPPSAPAVCQCFGPAQMPQATAIAPASFQSSTAATMVRYVGADASTELEKLCSAAVVAAVEVPGQSTLRPPDASTTTPVSAPAVSSLREELPGNPAATSSSGPSGGTVLFVIAGLASIMGLCMVVQVFVRRRHPSATGSLPSDNEGEQVPSMQVIGDLDVGDGV